jgi:hypothetical protein
VVARGGRGVAAGPSSGLASALVVAPYVEVTVGGCWGEEAIDENLRSIEEIRGGGGPVVGGGMAAR